MGQSSLNLTPFFIRSELLTKQVVLTPPQQNGVVETPAFIRLARAFKFQSQLPRSVWGDHFLTTTHVLNRLPTLYDST